MRTFEKYMEEFKYKPISKYSTIDSNLYLIQYITLIKGNTKILYYDVPLIYRYNQPQSISIIPTSNRDFKTYGIMKICNDKCIYKKYYEPFSKYFKRLPFKYIEGIVYKSLRGKIDDWEIYIYAPIYTYSTKDKYKRKELMNDEIYEELIR